MKIFNQITGIFFLSLLGTAVSELLPFSFPAGVLCMVVLFLLFCFGIVKTDSIRETSDFLARCMAIMFVPAGVGLIQYFDLLKTTLLPILIICLVSTLITFLATAYTVILVSRLQERLRKRGTRHD